MTDYSKIRADILAKKPATPSDIDEVRRFFLEATDPETELHTHYRAYGWPIEQELMERLIAFDQQYDLAVHDIKLLRRFLLKRYSFGNVLKLDRILRRRGVGFWWLCKDYVVPRIGLSLIVGFGLTLGASRLFDALRDLAAKRWLAAALVAVCQLLAVFLIYLNVRDTLGASAADDSAPGRRTFGIFVVAILWSGFELLLVYLMSLAMRGEPRFIWTWAFNWLHAAETASVAMVFAILTQFFFTKAGSMAEPL